MNPRTVASKALSALPVYRVLPPSSLRTYAALHYHWHNGSPEAASRAVIDGGSRMPSARFFHTSLIAARSAFRAGQDGFVRDALDALEQRFPAAAAVHELRSDLAVFHGDVEVALAHAERARLLEPASTQAWSRVIRLTYRVDGDDAGDPLAASAVARFPTAAPVLWAAGKACTTPGQYRRLEAAWRDAAPGPAALPLAVRQLATAAARAGLVDEAIALYGETIGIVAASGETAEVVPESRLEGRNPWAAIADLGDAFERAGVAYFLAAGTALGMVREGRPLDLDGDIDVGVLERDWDEQRLREVFSAHPRFDFDLAHPRTHKIALRHRGGSPVDVFRFYEEEGRVWHDAVFVRWHNTPFEVQVREVSGLPVPLPADEDRYLTENYGDWRTPRPGFDAFTDDAPNVELTWHEYLSLHLVRRAYRRLTAGEVEAATADLVAAGREDLVAPLRERAAGRSAAASAPVDVAAEDTSGAPAARMTVEEADAVVAEARRLRAKGGREDANELVLSSIREGGWRWGRLWVELVALMASPADYQVIRELWMVSPRRCHGSLPIVRSVARAAAIAGEQDEARAMLRKAILAAARRARRLRPRLGRTKRRVLASLPRRTGAADGSFEARAATALRELDRVLGEHGVRAFLISGTLLGYVRDAGFIPWDKDIDVGVFADEVDPVELEQAFERDDAFLVRRLDFTTDRLRVNHADGVMIDVFPHYSDDDGRVWHDGTATRWWNSPFGLTTVEFLGIELAVPDPPERYLDENYGDWRVPDPGFDARLDAPNVDVTDQAFLDTLHYFQLLRAVGSGNRAKLERYRALVRDLGEGAWVDRI